MQKGFLLPLYYLKSASKYSFSIMNFSKDSAAGAILFFLFGLLEQPCYNPVVSLAHILFLRTLIEATMDYRRIGGQLHYPPQ
jgi:hypothetical protein